MHNKELNLINDNSSFITRTYENLDFIHINSLNYKTNGIKRMLSLLFFHFKLHFLAHKFGKPDILVHTALPPFGNITYFTAHKLNAKYICEVVDLWPESFMAYGLVNKNNFLLSLAYRAERWLYKKSDKIVFSMEGGKKYIVSKKWDLSNKGPIDLSKVHYINNGVDLNDFDFNKKNNIKVDNDLINTQMFKVIYLGSIRKANNVKLLIDAASCLLDQKNLIFLIYGEGDERNFLEEYVVKNNIYNVKFKETWVEPKFVPYILSQGSLNVLNYMKTSVIQYGGSQSKLFQYLASGKPICSNQLNEFCLIKKNNLGISANFESKKDYADAIKQLMSLPKNEYDEMCERTRKTATDFDYQNLTNQLILLLKELL
jgi:glycosyltransferase involved in cell wall biosynthesis